MLVLLEIVHLKMFKRKITNKVKDVTKEGLLEHLTVSWCPQLICSNTREKRYFRHERQISLKNLVGLDSSTKVIPNQQRNSITTYFVTTFGSLF